MRRAPVLAFLVAFALCSSARPQRLAKSEKYRDANLGLSLTLPGPWSRVPQNPRETWVAARFMAETLGGKFKTRARVRLVVLPLEPDRVRAAMRVDPFDCYGIRTSGKGYAIYHDYVDATTPNILPGGKIYKLRTVGSGKTSAGEYVDFTVNERNGWLVRRARLFVRARFHAVVELIMDGTRVDEIDDLWKRILASVRKVTLAKRAKKTPPWSFVSIPPEQRTAWRKLSATRRRDVRRKQFRQMLDAIKKHTKPPWRLNETERLLVVSHGEKREKRYIAKLESFAAYLDDTLGELSDDFVRPWVVRIVYDGCHRDEMLNLARAEAGYQDVVLEMFDRREPDTHSFSNAMESMFWCYLHEKDPILGSVLPQWLKNGLSRTLYYSVRETRGKIDFEAGPWARGHAVKLHEDGKLLPLRKIITSTHASVGPHLRLGERMDVQCDLVMRFLLDPASAPAELRDFVPRYLAVLSDECAAAPGIEDESARAKALTEAYARANAKVLEIDEATWRRLNKAFVDFVLS